LEEFRGDPEYGEHFGWIDENDDKFINAQEWDLARSLGMGDWGAIAVRPGNARGQLEKGAIRWQLQKNIAYIPAPLLYQGRVLHGEDRGIITSLDPATGRILKVGRSSGALGEYYASPVAADGKVFLASTEGKISVLKAGPRVGGACRQRYRRRGQRHARVSDGRLYVRTRGALYCFMSAPGQSVFEID
jgi:outer membrane protein assembly factor BamB